MKIINKTLLVIALISTMCLCLCGCDEIDEMKAQQATWTTENNHNSITFNGDEYKLIPSNLTYNLKASPSNLNLNPVYVTEPDVPVLLSHDKCKALETNTDKTLIFGKDNDFNRTFMLYCRSDIYTEVLERLENGINYDGYGFSYSERNDDDGSLKEKFYTLDSAQNDVINKIENTCKKNHFDMIYEPGMHVTKLTKISEDNLFYSDYREIYFNIDNGKYFLTEYNYNENTSTVIQIPDEYNDTFKEIREIAVDIEF